MAHTLRDKKKLLDRIRRIQGQLKGVERGLLEEREPSDILRTLTACRGALDSLLFQVIEGHIRFHIVNPDKKPTSDESKATQELLDILKTHLT